VTSRLFSRSDDESTAAVWVPGLGSAGGGGGLPDVPEAAVAMTVTDSSTRAATDKETRRIRHWNGKLHAHTTATGSD